MPEVFSFLAQYFADGTMAIPITPGTRKDDYSEPHHTGKPTPQKAIYLGWTCLAIAHALAAFGGRLFLSPNGGRLKVLPSAYLREDPILLDPLVEPTKQTVESLALCKSYISQPTLLLPPKDMVRV